MERKSYKIQKIYEVPFVGKDTGKRREEKVFGNIISRLPDLGLEKDFIVDPTNKVYRLVVSQKMAFGADPKIGNTVDSDTCYALIASMIMHGGPFILESGEYDKRVSLMIFDIDNLYKDVSENVKAACRIIEQQTVEMGDALTKGGQ